MSDPCSHPHPLMLSFTLTLILNLCICSSLRLECPFTSLTKEVWMCKRRMCKRRVDSFFKTQNIITSSVEGLMIPSRQGHLLPTVSLPWPLHHSSVILSLLTRLALKPHPLWCSPYKQCCHWPTGARILRVLPICHQVLQSFFLNISLAFHFSPFLVPLPPFKLSIHLLPILS